MTDESVWSYRPGEWLAIFGASTTLLLPASEKARAAQLWDLVDGGAGFTETLDQVLAPGLSVLPAFVLIGTGEGPTKVIVRGAGVRAELTTEAETVVLDGSTVTTWVERTLDGVTALRVEVGDGSEGPDGAAGPDHLIRGGLVRVARIDLPPSRPVAAEPAEPAEPAPVLPPPAEDAEAPGAADDTGDVDLPVEPEPPSGPGPVWEDEGGALPPPPLPPPYVPPVPPVPPVVPGAVPDADLGGDHDGLTQAGDAPTEQFSMPQPGIPGQPPAPSVTRPVAQLVISNGETVEVDRVVLIGRAPEARRFTATEQPRLVTVPSPLHEISSTHVEVRPGSGADHGSAVVTDMGSTNGTVLIQPGLGPEDLKPGIAVQLIPGAIINLGDGVTIQVTNP